MLAAGRVEALAQLSRPTSAVVDNARRVIEIESAGVTALIAIIDDQFVRAVELIVETKGRLIVTGIGKSGHIGRKFAATLCATGQKAFFVHAGEAAHGDLGAMSSDDVIVLLSNSGRSAELSPILDFARKHGMATVGITASVDSPLMRRVSVQLKIPRMAEACPVKIAPTTSTTMMLALCDALAIAAMHQRGTTRDDVMALHPAGAIGFQDRSIRSLLSPATPLPLVRPDSPLRDVVLDMTVAGRGIAGVIDDDGALIGTITDGDLRRSFDRILIARASDIMTDHPKVMTCDMTVVEALTLLNEHRITAAFVMPEASSRRPIGLLNIHDLNGAV